MKHSWFTMLCCCCPVTKLCPTLWGPMDYSTPGFPVLHCLLELAQTHVHWVSDAVQPSHPLSPPSPLALSLSQHQSCVTFRYIANWFSFMYKYTFSVEKAMAPHSSTLAWRLPWMEEPGRLQSMGSLRVGHDWATSFSLFIFVHWRRKWQPTPGFLPGESQGWGSLVGCCLWGLTEWDTTEAT